MGERKRKRKRERERDRERDEGLSEKLINKEIII